MFVPLFGGSTGTRGRLRTLEWQLSVLLSVLVMAMLGVPGIAAAGPPSSSTSSGADILCESEEGNLNVSVHGRA
jgi:hypothetical protein